MGFYSFKLPDLGEGIVESEIDVWHVSPGDAVEEDQHIADVITEKAVVEITAPVAGTVVAACDTLCSGGRRQPTSPRTQLRCNATKWRNSKRGTTKHSGRNSTHLMPPGTRWTSRVSQY